MFVYGWRHARRMRPRARRLGKVTAISTALKYFSSRVLNGSRGVLRNQCLRFVTSPVSTVCFDQHSPFSCGCICGLVWVSKMAWLNQDRHAHGPGTIEGKGEIRRHLTSTSRVRREDIQTYFRSRPSTGGRRARPTPGSGSGSVRVRVRVVWLGLGLGLG